MSLTKGNSEKALSTNIRRLMREYNRSGTIGKVTPRGKKHAQEIASAIAHDLKRSAGSSKKKRRKKR